MLAILTSHPIQYQVPIWRALAEDGRVPFTVWYLTPHGVAATRDPGFGRSFSWDIDLLEGYPSSFLRIDAGWDLSRFRGVRLKEHLVERMKRERIDTLWVEGWRFEVFWRAIRAARKLGIRTWMRGDSNDLKMDSMVKRLVKRPLLSRVLGQVDEFLCIGCANRRLYESYGVGRARCHSTPHCVDNDRFSRQAADLRPRRAEVRRQWNVPEDAFCVLFCGKYIPKKRPLDLVEAARQLVASAESLPKLHLLFVGDGDLKGQIKRGCQLAFDAENEALSVRYEGKRPTASFVGFLNQSTIVEAYVAADVLVLPSDSGETWGLVANEAMSCGTPAIVSDLCGCAEDLVALLDRRLVFRCGAQDDLAASIRHVMMRPPKRAAVESAANTHHLRHTVLKVAELYQQTRATC